MSWLKARAINHCDSFMDHGQSCITLARLMSKNAYNSFELNEPSQDLYVIVTLFGKYNYKWLPMDSNVLLTLHNKLWRRYYVMSMTLVFSLTILVPFSMKWEHHILLLDKFLHWLEANGFTANLLKCKCAIQETDWLWFWLMLTGSKRWCKILMVSCKCKNLNTSHRCAVSFVLSITTNSWGPSAQWAHRLSPLSSSQERNPSIGLPKWTLNSNPWEHSWHKTTPWLTLTKITISHYTDASSYWMGAYIVQDNANSMMPNWDTLLVARNSFPLLWSWQSSTPCFLVLNYTFTPTT